MNEGEFHMHDMDMFRTPGFAWRVGLSIVVAFGWIGFVIVWLFFYADKYSVAQNIAMFLLSVIVALGILAAAWATWGIRYASKFGREPHMEKPRGTTVINAVAGVGWLVFLVIWLFFYASDYNGYQNLAIFILSLMVLGAVTGSVWIVKWLRVRTKMVGPPAAPPATPPSNP